MKKKITICFALCSVIVVSLVFGIVSANAANSDGKVGQMKSPVFQSPIKTEDTYIPPVNPYDTPEKWAEFTSYEERLNATQVPEKVLKKISTAGLVNTVLSSHFFCSHIFSDTSPQAGFDTNADIYNGLHELLLRKDSGTALLELYKAIDLKALYERDAYAFLRLQSIEMLLSQDCVLRTLSSEQMDELVNLCIDRAYEISENDDYAEIFSLHTRLLLVLRCLNLSDESVAEMIKGSLGLQDFIDTGSLSLNDVSDSTFDTVFDYLDKKR